MVERCIGTHEGLLSGVFRLPLGAGQQASAEAAHPVVVLTVEDVELGPFHWTPAPPQLLFMCGLRLPRTFITDLVRKNSSCLLGDLPAPPYNVPHEYPFPHQ